MLNNKNLEVFLFLLLITAHITLIGQNNPSTLLKNWVIAQEKGTEPALPNFSFAGYHNGETALPATFTQTIFDVTDPAYGAIPNDGNSDKEAIIAAIAAAEATPNGGIVFFPSGEFHINESTDDIDKIIRITKNNIVLKGSGSGAGGTTLIQSSYTNPSNPNNYWSCPYLIQFKPTNTNRTTLCSITANATRETYSVEVSNTSGISVGQWVRLILSDNDPSLIAEEFAPYDVVAAYTSITAEVKTWEIHRVAAINGTSITFVEPLHKSIDARYNWSLETFPVLEEVGIQDLNYQGGMTTNFVHHSGWQQDSGWSGISMSRVVNSWVSNIEFTQMSNAAQFVLSGYSSAIKNKYIGNPGHAFISANASTGCLIGLNTDSTSGIHHGCGVSGPSIGNTLWRNEHPTNGNSGIEVHANQPRANLIDACKGGIGKNYGGSEVNQPNHLRHLVIWNFEGKGYVDTNFEFWRNNFTYGKVIPPIVSGLVGFSISEDTSQSITGLDKQYQVNESPGTHVDELSLYETQLTHRLGILPTWIEEALRTETFEKTVKTGWSTETYIGENGIPWTLNAKNTAGYIDPTKEIYMQSGKTGVSSGTIKGGISSFSVTCKDLWNTGVDRKLELLINGIAVASKTHNGTEIYTFQVNNIDIEGDVTIALKNASSTQMNNTIAIDKLIWTGYTVFHPSGIELSSNNVLFQIGDTLTLKETVYPSYAIDKNVSWSSSDTSIATVDQNGFVTAVSTGIATISSITEDQNLTATCEVNIAATETFENTSSTGWTTETYTGDNGFIWTLIAKSTSGYINTTKDIYIRSGKIGAQSGPISGGISSFSVTCKDLWDYGTERTLELLINGNTVDTFKHTGSEIYTYTVENINIEGDITIGLKNASATNSNKSIAIDNMVWTPFKTRVQNKKSAKIKQIDIKEDIQEPLVYPNPFKRELYILLQENYKELSIINIQGKLILKKPIIHSTNLLITPSYDTMPPGLYFIQLTGSEHTKTMRLIRN